MSFFNRIARFFIFLSLVFFFLALEACSSGNGGKVAAFTDTVYSPKYANGFSILRAPGKSSVLVTTSNPWQGNTQPQQLLVLRNGESVPDDYTGMVLDGDAQRVIAMSTTHVAMLDAVDAVDAIVGVSGLDYISNKKISASRNSIGDVGYEGNINYELLVALEPDLVLIYGVNGPSAMAPKLRELNIPFLYVGDYLEDSPLGKAEWMVAVGEVTGHREKALDVFKNIPIQYNALKDSVARLTDNRPKVMLNAPYADTWHLPPLGSYAVQLINDAGATFIYDKNKSSSSQPVDMETAYSLVAGSDFWINPGTVSSLNQLSRSCPKFSDTRCFTSGNVFNNNLRSTPTGGNDYFESAVVNPHLVLRDLIKIFHPQLIDSPFVYYQRLP